MDILERLEGKEAAYRQTLRQADRLLKERDDLIVRAAGEGLSKSRIATVTGLSRGRIGQVVNDPTRKEAA